MDPQNPPAAQGGDTAVTAANNTNNADNADNAGNMTNPATDTSLLERLNALAPGGGIAQTQAQNQVQNQEQGQGQPVVQAQPVQQPQPVDESDPLRKLMSMVKGNDGAVDELKVKQLFVNVGNKLSNKSLRYIVEQYQKQNLPAEAIVTLLLDLDEKVEMGEYNEELFQKLNETNEW